MNIRTNSRRHTPQSKMPAILSILLTIMFTIQLIALMIYAIPESNKEIIIYMAGQLGTAWLLAIGYYFSSTSSSKNKDQLLADSVPVQRKDDESP